MRLARFISVLLILCCIAVVLSQEKSSRLWKDTSGKLQVRANLIEQDGSTAKLHTEDGRELKVPIDRLSLEDREYLKGLAAPIGREVD